MVDPEYEEQDVPPAEGDLVADDREGDSPPVPLADPDVDGEDPAEVEQHDGPTSGPDDEG